MDIITITMHDGLGAIDTSLKKRLEDVSEERRSSERGILAFSREAQFKSLES